MKWLMDELLTERNDHPGVPTLADAAIELGHDVYRTKYVPFSREPDENIPFDHGDCVVAYGTHEFICQLERAFPGKWTPGWYHRCPPLAYSGFSPYLGDLMFNNEFSILPWGEIMRRGLDGFVRPDAVTKRFTGQVIKTDTYDADVAALNQVEGLTPDILCVIAPPKEITGEYRFIIADGDVVTGSEYRWDNKLDIRIDVAPQALELAQEVACREWQADAVYTCDVATDKKDQAWLLELNTFSCSGLYACDRHKIVEAVSASAMNEAGLLGR